MLASFRRRLANHDRPPAQHNARSSLDQLCQVCEQLCKSSKLLNDQEYCNSVRLAGEAVLKDSKIARTERLLVDGFFTDSMRDVNQWNDTERFLFEDEFPHHVSGTALHKSAQLGCHLCNLFWSYMSVERYGILIQEIDLEILKSTEASREAARRQICAQNAQLYARVGMQIGSQGGYLTIVVYVGQQVEKLPEVRGAVAVWRTKGVSGMFSTFRHILYR